MVKYTNLAKGNKTVYNISMIALLATIACGLAVTTWVPSIYTTIVSVAAILGSAVYSVSHIRDSSVIEKAYKDAADAKAMAFEAKMLADKAATQVTAIKARGL